MIDSHVWEMNLFLKNLFYVLLAFTVNFFLGVEILLVELDILVLKLASELLTASIESLATPLPPLDLASLLSTL